MSWRRSLAGNNGCQLSLTLLFYACVTLLTCAGVQPDQNRGGVLG